MKKLMVIALLIASSAQAKQAASYFQKVSGMDALKDQHLNQYDDTSNPPQAFDVTLPAGYSLSAADVESAGVSVCSVTSYNSRTQRLSIEALSIETDAGTCVITLTVFSSQEKREIKVHYSIEQTGT